MILDVVEGWTGPIDVQLLNDGQVPETPMDQMGVELILRDSTGALVDIQGAVTVLDADTWTVRYVPDANDLKEGAYTGRFKVTDGFDQVGFFPSGIWDSWIVRKS